MRITKTAPSATTIPLLCWEFEIIGHYRQTTDRRLMQLFTSCYNPVTWGELPMPTSDDLATKKHQIFCDFMRTLNRGEVAFKHLVSLFSIPPNDDSGNTFKLEERLVTYVLGSYGQKIVSLEFVEWFLTQDFYNLCPFAIAEMVKSLPFSLVKKYADMPMRSGYRGHDQYANNPSKYQEIAYYEAFREYKFLLMHHTDTSKGFDLSFIEEDKVKGFVYFYNKCPLWRVVDSFSHIMNSVIYYLTDESKDRIQAYLEYFEALYCSNTVHNINEIWCYDWYEPKLLTKVVNREHEERKYHLKQPSVFNDIYPDGC